MKKYIELIISGSNSSMISYIQRLTIFSSDKFYYKEMRRMQVNRDGYYIEFAAKRSVDYKARVILSWNGDDIIRLSNIIPRTVSFLEIEQYNSVIKHFYTDVIDKIMGYDVDVNISKEENSMKDLISARSYNALLLWEELCDKNAPTTHPNDRQRWMDFICELSINGDHLSLSDFKNWLIEDRGWYYDVEDRDDKIFLNLEIDLEFGQDLLTHYAEKTRFR